MGKYDFIIGPAGSGKTTFVYKTLTKRTLEEKNTRFFLFVPEQNTLKAQQELVRHSDVHGLLTLDVLSLSQLSYRVLEELGKPAPDVLDDVSRSILLRRALTNVKDGLSVYRSKIGSPGFIAQLKTALSEFSQYSIQAADLKRLSPEVSTSLLEGKLKDLGLIQEEFMALLSGSGKITVVPEEVPRLLIEHIDSSHLLDNAVIYFDGFTGFTPLQLEIIGRMAAHVKEMHFTLTIPEEQLHPKCEHYTDLFYLSRETRKKLIDILSLEGLRQGEDLILPDRHPQKKKLSSQLSVPAGLETKVCILEDPTDEIRYIASRISLKARLEGQRYRKMAVAVSDLASYKEIIRREFTAAKIPFFLDDRMPAAGSPVIELLRSVLHIIRDGYDYEDIVTYLKNPLLQKKDGKLLNLMDNYIFACGLRGRGAYERSWKERSFVPLQTGEYLPALEAFKDEMLMPVFALHDTLKEAKSCGRKAETLRKFLEELGITKEEADPTEPDKQRISGDDVRFLELTEELLERLSALFSDEEMDIAAFTELVEAGFQDMKAGMIPASMDCVSIGDLKRSRFDDIESLYLIGAVEGKIPQTVTGGGIFTDRERMELINKQLELAPDDRHDASIQNFYLYLTVNKPEKSLEITLPGIGRDGKQLKASMILKGAALEHPSIEPVTADAFLGDLAAGLGQRKTKTEEETGKQGILLAQKILSDDPDAGQRLQDLSDAAGFSYQEVPLTEATAGLLYELPLKGSVTRLEQFERCPYRHFLDYGLKLKERESWNVEMMDLGKVYHHVLDEVLSDLKKKGISLGDVTDDELGRLAAEKTELITAQMKGEIFRETARNRYISEQIRRITEKTLRVLAGQYRSGDFKTEDTEHRFRICEPGLVLEGSIDRIDTLKEDGKTYLKIIDYKSGRAEFDLVLAYEGLQMQLAAYAAAALEQQKQKGIDAAPAGMLLYKIQDPIIKADEVQDAMKAFRMNGLCLEDEKIAAKMDHELELTESSNIIPVHMKDGKIQQSRSCVLPEEDFTALLNHTREVIRKDAKRITEGEITVRPAVYGQTDSCEYCPMHAVCGFDRQLPGYQTRDPKKIKKEEVLRQLKQG